MRFLLECIRPGDAPVLRRERRGRARRSTATQRSLVYQRAKDVEPTSSRSAPQLDVYEAGYKWINAFDGPRPMADDPEHAASIVGGPDCTQPYSSSILNISAMSFGALSAHRDPRDEQRARSSAASRTTPAKAGSRRYHREPAAT